MKDIIEVIHNEKNYVVCIKKAGILSEKSDGKTPGMVDLLKEELDTDIYTVHRLDREASGVMVYAKNTRSAAKLSELFANKEVFEKSYLIIVHGKPEEDKGIMEDLLFKDSKKNKSFVVGKMRKGVKEARLEYEKIAEKEYKNEVISLIKVKLHTGRTHQIRVQFSSRNMPVFADSRYGSKKEGDMCLYSYLLSFNNPFDKENKRVTYKNLPQNDVWDCFREEISKI